jgi:hypothetical protein
LPAAINHSLLQVLGNIRGLEKVLGVPCTPAEYACFLCWMKGFRACQKQLYCGHYTQLPLGHELRAVLAPLNQGSAADGDEDSTLVPARRTMKQLERGKHSFIASHTS